MDIYQIILLINTVAILVTLILITKPWDIPKDNMQRWIRSLLTGTGTTLIVISGLVIMGYSQSTGNCIKEIPNITLSSLLCVGIPVFIVVTLGNYMGYRQIIWLNSIRKKHRDR